MALWPAPGCTGVSGNPQAKRFVVPITAQLTDWDEKLIADIGRDAVIAFRCKGREFIGYCAAERPSGMTEAAPASISRYPVPALDKMPADIRARILKVQEKSGFIPNVFLMLAHRPDEFRAFMAYHDALMDKEGGLTKAEREMIVVATSAANQCQYCVIAHGAILRVRARNPLIADQIAANYRKAEITPRQRAMLDFAMKVARQAEEVDEADSDVLRGHGFSDDDVCPAKPHPNLALG